MPKQSRESVIAELDARKTGYTDEMSYAELCELLKKAQDAGKPEIPGEVLDEPIDYSNVRVGQSTVEDLHRRVTLLERKLNA